MASATRSKTELSASIRGMPRAIRFHENGGPEVLRLHDERAPAHREAVELTVDALEGVEPARGRAERRPGAVGPAVGIAGDRVHRHERGGTQRLDVSQPVALHAQRGLLGLVRRRLLDLAQLELEQVQLALAARQRRQPLLGQRRLDPAHPRMCEPAHARGISLPAWGTS